MSLFIQRPKGAYAPPATGGVPIGGIIMWSGTVATIPANWQLCDGTNSTPDLRDKFVVGAKQDDAGVAKTNLTGSLTQSGGNANHTHPVTSNVAVSDHSSHAHSGSTAHSNHTHTGPSHQHNLSGGAATAHSHTYTDVPNHVHVQNFPSSFSGGSAYMGTDTTVSGSTASYLSTANNTSGVATGTTANNTAGATDNAGTGATGNESASLSHGNTGNETATITHGVTNNAVTSGNNSTQPPYYALAFIQRMS